MGFLDSILRRQDPTTTTPTTTPTALERASDVMARTGTSLGRTGSMILERGTQYYKANPRKVQALGLLAAAALLVGVRNRGRM